MREKLLDKNYVEKHIVDIYSLEEYIPMIITGMFFGIDISTEARSQWSHTIRDNRPYGIIESCAVLLVNKKYYVKD